MHWLPTWKLTPIRSWVARRAASSREGALVGLHAELARQAVQRALGLGGHAHDQVSGRWRGPVEVDDLGQLLVRVEREGAHPMVEVGRGDGRGGSSPGA